MPLWDFAGGPQYDVVDAKLAANFGDGTFDTAVDIPSIDMYVTRFNMKSQTARGDGRITAVAGQVESAGVTFRNASINQTILGILIGATAYDSGNSGEIRRTKIGPNRTKWFGICGKSLAGDEGDTHIFLPYCRVMEQFEYNFSYNEFAVPQITAMALGDPVLLDDRGEPLIVDIIEHATEVAVAIPPAA